MTIEIRAEAKAKALEICKAGFKLSSGHNIPAIGFGTWALTPGTDTVEAVKCALQSGYRLIDGAAFYGNEISVGQALAQSGVPREELFITSKVWIDSLGYQKTIDAFMKSLRELNLEYLDLYLIHWPASPYKHPNWERLNLETWQAMIKLYQDGYIRTIGVSNFKELHLSALMETQVQPMVNQIEIHPGYSQRKLIKFCQDNNIVVEGWSPFGRGTVLSNNVVNDLAKKYQRTPAQICLRFARQLGVIPIPKSASMDRMSANLDIFDFSISNEDMLTLYSLDTTKVGFSGEDPDL